MLLYTFLHLIYSRILQDNYLLDNSLTAINYAYTFPRDFITESENFH